jgi:hypothetical protein
MEMVSFKWHHLPITWSLHVGTILAWRRELIMGQAHLHTYNPPEMTGPCHFQWTGGKLPEFCSIFFPWIS